MTKYFLKGFTISFLSSSLIMLHAQEAAPKNSNLVDSLTMTAVGMLATNLKGYKPTADISTAVAGGSAFISGDVLVTADSKKANASDLKDFISVSGAAADKKQADAILVLKESYQKALEAAKSKLALQQLTSSKFGDAAATAEKLADNELAQEKKCTESLEQALTTIADSVNQNCSEMGKDPLKKDEAQKCSDELAACMAKINTDKTQFDAYIVKRNTPMASIAGLKEVSELRTELLANIPASANVCSNYSKALAAAESGGGCISKMNTDKKNESSGKLDTSAKGDTLSKLGIDSKSESSFITVAGKRISKDFDQSMLIPEHRAVLWQGMKELADSAAAATTAEIEKIEAILVKVDKLLRDMGVVANNSADNTAVGILTNTGTTVSVEVIKKFFATNPSPESILKEAAALGLTADQIAHAMNIGGYNGGKSSNLNNYAETKAVEDKYLAQVRQMVQSKGGNFSGAEGSLQIPGVARMDSTKNVMSNQGWITPAMVKSFMDTNPTDQQLFAKMAELGLRRSDLGSILNGQGLLFKDGNPTQVLLNDKDFGSIYNRLDNELYSGTTGYGEADTYDPHSLIVKGTGHIYSEEKKTWIPYGFKDGANQHVDGRNQAPVPTTFTSGGQFGVSRAFNPARVLKPSELKQMRTK